MKILLIQHHGGFQTPQQQSQQLNPTPPIQYEEAIADSNESLVDINPFYSSPEAMVAEIVPQFQRLLIFLKCLLSELFPVTLNQPWYDDPESPPAANLLCLLFF